MELVECEVLEAAESLMLLYIDVRGRDSLAAVMRKNSNSPPSSSSGVNLLRKKAEQSVYSETCPFCHVDGSVGREPGCNFAAKRTTYKKRVKFQEKLVKECEWKSSTSSDFDSGVIAAAAAAWPGKRRVRPPAKLVDEWAECKSVTTSDSCVSSSLSDDDGFEAFLLPEKKRKVVVLMPKPISAVKADEGADDYDYRLKPRKTIKKKMKNKNSAGGSKSISEHKMNNKTEHQPKMPENFLDKINSMRGTDVKLIIQKRLSMTDLSKRHNRVSIPFRNMENDFLTDDERAPLETKDETGHWTHMNVPLLDPSLKSWTISVRKWISGSGSEQYVLNKPWLTITKENELGPGVVIQLYGFRVDRQLHFAMVKLQE